MRSLENRGFSLDKSAKMYIEKNNPLKILENTMSSSCVYRNKNSIFCTDNFWSLYFTCSVIYKKLKCLNMYVQKNLLIKG